MSAPLKTFTAWCQQSNGEGTIWIETIGVPEIQSDFATDDEIEAARLVARIACADDWGCDPENVHCLGLAKGDVEIVDWCDID